MHIRTEDEDRINGMRNGGRWWDTWRVMAEGVEGTDVAPVSSFFASAGSGTAAVSPDWF